MEAPRSWRAPACVIFVLALVAQWWSSWTAAAGRWRAGVRARRSGRRSTAAAARTRRRRRAGRRRTRPSSRRPRRRRPMARTAPEAAHLLRLATMAPG
uniref:Uncharacterized protein n=1 Tax=Oryza barthii TaxID=65489 RepID=A0A0D3H260_9ORYZ